MTKKIILITLKSLISSTLIFYIFNQIDFNDFKTLLDLKSIFIILGITFFLTLSTVITGYRWKLILKNMSNHISVGWASINIIIGMFFNLFLPSSFGGDVYRIYHSNKNGINLSIASLSIVSDRFFGLLTLVMLSFLSIPAVLIKPYLQIFLIPILIILFFFIITLSLFYFALYLPNSNIFFLKVSRLSKNIIDSINLKNFKFKILLISMILHIFNILCFYIASFTVNFHLNIFTWFIIIPPVILISSIPISIGGWGVREGLLILALVELGANQIEATKISIIYGISLMLVGIIGGIFWVFVNNKTKSY